MNAIANDFGLGNINYIQIGTKQEYKYFSYDKGAFDFTLDAKVDKRSESLNKDLAEGVVNYRYKFRFTLLIENKSEYEFINDLLKNSHSEYTNRPELYLSFNKTKDPRLENSEAYAVVLPESGEINFVPMKRAYKIDFEFMSKHTYNEFPNLLESKNMLILKSFPGMKTEDARYILNKIKDVGRFTGIKKFCGYSGIAPTHKAEYAFILELVIKDITKRAIEEGSYIKEIYDLYISKCKTPETAFKIAKHKVARLLFSMLKRQRKFNKNIDIGRRQNSS